MRALLFLLACTLAPLAVISAPEPDTLHVVSHNKTLVVTDPSRGFNTVAAWGHFPGRAVAVRNLLLEITYRCPDSLHCGEWDYVDGVYLVRTGGEKGATTHLELARMISPYGWRFGAGWSFTWQCDVTDFAFMLRDSCLIEFYHSGYENNKDRGWLVTLDFRVITGPPVMEPLGMDTLWTGNFPYGDSIRPIELWLTNRKIQAPVHTGLARLRVLQTGHGMDEQQNCAEFCSKWREITFDGKVADRRNIWKRCGDNPLYPQAGTWIFNRANWCPGEVVEPQWIDLPAGSGSHHTLGFGMEPYTCRKPTAGYNISSQVFYYRRPGAKHDVTINEILVPGVQDTWRRLNPACANPVVRITNQGREPLRSLTFTYGTAGMALKEYTWTGSLAPLATGTITLPGVIGSAEGHGKFMVALSKPNGKPDEYPFDNSLSATFISPPLYATALVVAMRTNRDSTHTSYCVVSSAGDTIMMRKGGALRATTLYLDTLILHPGCYRLVATDTAGDGLDFWFNPEGGYGYIRLLDMEGRLIKSFGSDFGNTVNHWFTVAAGAKAPSPVGELPIVNPFPVRNRGVFELEIFFNEPHDVKVQVINSDSTRLVFEREYKGLKSEFLPIDISVEPDGFYYVKVISGERIVRRKIKVKHKD